MIEVSYTIVSESDRVILTRVVNGIAGARSVVSSEADVHGIRDPLLDIPDPGHRTTREKLIEAVRALKREPWTATVSTSAQGFPIQLPERLLNRRVKITIEDLGEAY